MNFSRPYRQPVGFIFPEFLNFFSGTAAGDDEAPRAFADGIDGDPGTMGKMITKALSGTFYPVIVMSPELDSEWLIDCEAALARIHVRGQRHQRHFLHLLSRSRPSQSAQGRQQHYRLPHGS